MCNSRPGYRGGWALALRADNEPISDDRVLSLDRDEAVAMGRHVIRNEPALTDEFVERFFSAYPERLREFKERGGDARLDFTHGVIDDFQNLFFETDKFQHRARLCLTVCQHGKKSKIWFRTECLKIKSKEGDWVLPVGLSEEELSSFFDEAESMSNIALIELQSIYQRNLQEFADNEMNGDRVLLHLEEQFEFKAFDSDHEQLHELFFDLKTGISFTEWVEAQLKVNERGAEPAIVTINLAIPDDLHIDETIKFMRGNEDISIVDHASIDGELGVFIKRRSRTHGQSKPKVTFVGAAYDADSRSENRGYGESPAFRLSAEMIASVTSRI